jgi:hypothetical protein
MDAQIRVPTESASFKLSQLLIQEMEVIEEGILAILEFIHRPKELWHARTMNCLAKKGCSPIQSESERQYIVLKVRRKNVCCQIDIRNLKKRAKENFLETLKSV